MHQFRRQDAQEIVTRLYQITFLMRYFSSFKLMGGLPFPRRRPEPVLNEALILKANTNALFSFAYSSARLKLFAPAAVSIHSKTLLKFLVINLSHLCLDRKTLSEL